MRVSRIQFYFHSANLAVPKALKLRERLPAMANPHKSERTRACGDKAKITSVPKGVNKKNFAGTRKWREWESFFSITNKR